MAYGTIKVDNITFDDGGVDKLITVSGLFFSTSGALTVTGTISGGNVTAPTATFTTLTGTTTAGTTATFTSGSFTTLTGTTVTGTTANFVSGVFTTQISGATITGTTVATTTGSFVSLTGTTATFTSGIIASGTAALPSLAILSDPNTGIYSPGADQLAISTNGTGRITVDASGNVNIDSNTLYVDAVNNWVGIGTSSPQQDLHINDATGVSRIRLSGGAANADNFDIGQSIPGVSNSGFSIYDVDATANRLVIDSTGNVGIGTTAPVALLQIGTGNTSATTSKAVFNTGDTTAAALELSNWTGSATTNGPQIVFDNSGRGAFSIGGGNGVHSFVIRDTGAASDRLNVDSSGRLLVGTSTASGTAALQVPGSLRAGNSGDGGSDGNNVTQVAATPPSGALMAEIFCVGNYYSGTANTHTGFYSACWSSFTNTITVIKDVNHSAGANQGFEAVWSGTQVVVRNKTAMSTNQGGRAFIRWLA